SYIVVPSALTVLYEIEEVVGFLAVEVLEDTANDEVILSVANVYFIFSSAEQNNFFIAAFDRVDSYSKYALSSFYGEYLKEQSVEVHSKAVPLLTKEASKEEIWWIRMMHINNLKKLKEENTEKLKTQKKALDKQEN